MKILIYILAILSIPVGLFASFVSYAALGLDLYSTGLGKAACIVGSLTVVVCVICAVLGIIKMRKGQKKQAFAFVLVGVIYCIIVGGLMGMDEVISTQQLENSIADLNEELYGEDWDSPSAIEGIPEHYEKVLNEYYAIVRDEWPAEELMIIGAVSMAEYYGDMPLDNIGFALKDLNGDGVDEMLIGTTAPVEEGGTAIFCIYSDPENPFYSISSMEGETYYMHSGETEGIYMVEIAGRDAAWLIGPAGSETILDINYQEGALDPSGRMTLELIPFSQYK